MSTLAAVLVSGGCAGPRPISDDAEDFAGGVADVDIGGDADVDVGGGVGLRPNIDAVVGGGRLAAGGVGDAFYSTLFWLRSVGMWF